MSSDLRLIMGDTVFSVWKYSFFGALITYAIMLVILFFGGYFSSESKSRMYDHVIEGGIFLMFLYFLATILWFISFVSGLVIIYRAFILTRSYREKLD